MLEEQTRIDARSPGSGDGDDGVVVMGDSLFDCEDGLVERRSSGGPHPWQCTVSGLGDVGRGASAGTPSRGYPGSWGVAVDRGWFEPWSLRSIDDQRFG